jgi:hypothetical protein
MDISKPYDLSDPGVQLFAPFPRQTGTLGSFALALVLSRPSPRHISFADQGLVPAGLGPLPVSLLSHFRPGRPPAIPLSAQTPPSTQSPASTPSHSHTHTPSHALTRPVRLLRQGSALKHHHHHHHHHTTEKLNPPRRRGRCSILVSSSTCSYPDVLSRSHSLSAGSTSTITNTTQHNTTRHHPTRSHLRSYFTAPHRTSPEHLDIDASCVGAAINLETNPSPPKTLARSGGERIGHRGPH